MLIVACLGIGTFAVAKSESPSPTIKVALSHVDNVLGYYTTQGVGICHVYKVELGRFNTTTTSFTLLCKNSLLQYNGECTRPSPYPCTMGIVYYGKLEIGDIFGCKVSTWTYLRTSTIANAEYYTNCRLMSK